MSTETSKGRNLEGEHWRAFGTRPLPRMGLVQAALAPLMRKSVTRMRLSKFTENDSVQVR